MPLWSPPRALWLALPVFFALACGSGDTGPAGGPPPPIPVKVVSLAPSVASDQVRAPGAVEAVRTAELRPEAQGTVAAVLFDDGQRVSAGALLVRLHQDAEKARLADAEARWTLAQARHDRVRALFDRGDAARQELDTVVAERDLAVAARDLARDGLRRTEVRAPFAGTVGRREVSVGATVGPQVAVTRIEDLSELFVEINLPERDLPAIHVGSAAVIRVDALPGRAFDGAVTYVAPRVDAATRTFAVRVSLPPADDLRPGLISDVAITTGTRAEALLVPTHAIVPGGDGPGVWVVDAEGKARRVAVQTQGRDDAHVEVVGGLSPGDRVIVEGLVKLRPGAPVKVEAP